MDILKDYTKRQKIILTIYAVVSFPVLPLMALYYPFVKWVTSSSGETKLDLVEFLSLSMAVSLFVYLVGSILWWLPR